MTRRDFAKSRGTQLYYDALRCEIDESRLCAELNGRLLEPKKDTLRREAKNALSIFTGNITKLPVGKRPRKLPKPWVRAQ